MVTGENHTDKSRLGSAKIRENADCLAQEINWFARQVNRRTQTYFKKELLNGTDMNPGNESPDEAPPDISGTNAVLAEFVRYYQLSPEERMLLVLAVIPHVQPHLLDVFFTANKASGRGYTEFGGIRSNRHSGFIPTVETALFILAGNDLEKRFRLYRLFEPDHILLAHNIIVLDKGQSGESFCNSSIGISEEYLDFFTTGKMRKPAFSTEFPAKQLVTQMRWSDLVVDDFTARQLEEIRTWMKHGHTLMNEWGMSRLFKNGYKALFYGPPGTGKTMTAALLGKQFGLDVYRIDLSMVISKYIGETEQNLEKVFKKAENKNWILFFDEADALMGKRTGITDAHDKYANQEIAYLLQRLEDYPSMVILASNMRANVDEAFTRRLQAVIAFNKPQYPERLRIWKNSFSSHCIPPPEDELDAIARQFELTGGSIVNVIHHASLQSLARNDNRITGNDLLAGVRREFRKEGKTI